jgi:hypothetical protein
MYVYVCIRLNVQTHIRSADTHWRKWLLRWMVANKSFLIFPGTEGTLATASPSSAMNRHLLCPAPPLLTTITSDSATTSAVKPPVNVSHFEDAYGQRVNSTSELVALHTPSAFDQCTLVLTVYDRYPTLPNRLAHYQFLPDLSSIVVIWNYVNATPLVVRPGQYKVPVHVLRMEVNSMNNRFTYTE